MNRLYELVKTKPEPLTHFSDALVHKLLTESPREYLDHIRMYLQWIHRGKAVVVRPPKAVLTDPKGDYRSMPCTVRTRNKVCKTVKVVGTNNIGRIVPNQITVGKAFRLDPDENFITHSIDACLFSSARTGACAAVGVELFRPHAKRIQIIGTGRVGAYAALYLSHLSDVEQISLFDLEKTKSAALALALPIHSVTYTTGLMTDPDVVVLATNSNDPVLTPEETPASLVVSLGADAKGQRELADGWKSYDLIVDSLDCLEAGDLHHWGTTAYEVQKMINLPAAPDRSVFISTGSALFDNLTVSYLLDKYEQSNS